MNVFRKLLLKSNTSVILTPFFKNKAIFIRRHNCYADYSEPSHQFLELNCVYKGTRKLQNECLNEKSKQEIKAFVASVQCVENTGNCEKSPVLN